MRASLPREGGTYALLLALQRDAQVRVGRLGEVTLPAGRYAYVGSARGPGGLAARVGRHFRAETAPHQSWPWT